MKRLSCKILALICILVVLFGCGGVIGTVVASSDGQDEHSWWVFPPEGFEDVTVSANAGKRLRVASGSCETILPSNVNRDFLALYVRVTLSEAVADALNEEGYIEVGNAMDGDERRIKWYSEDYTWKTGLNEKVLLFSQATYSVDVTKPFIWFCIEATTLESNGTIVVHEASIVDATEGGILFGKNDTHLQLSKPLSATPNTIEASVKVDADAKLTAERYAIFSTLGSEDAQPVALAMTAAGALVFTWGDKEYAVDCNVRTGEWVDIAIARNMTDKKFYVYLDGVPKMALDATGTSDIIPAVAHRIGADGDGSAVFSGYIADVRAWSDVRSAQEIKDNRVEKEGNRRNGLAADAEGLIGAWYLLGDLEYVLTVQEDSSVNQNHAVCRGSRADDWLDYDKTQYDFLYDAEGNEDYYSMVVIPDIQNISTAAYQKYWLNIAGWIGDNVDTENIVHVMGLGDSTWNNQEGEFARAREGWDLFANKVSWNNVPGNHDYKANISYRKTEDYTNAFGEDYLNATASKGVYQGYFHDPYGRSTVENSYYCFGVNGVRWMVVQLEYAPRQHVLSWANSLIQSYADHNVIIVTHGYMNGDATRCGFGQEYLSSDKNEGGSIGSTSIAIWEKVMRDNDNVQMLFCGHNRNEEGSIAIRRDVNPGGRVVPQIMINAQGLDVGENGEPSYFKNQPMAMLGILRFSADGTQVALQYYSPVHDKSYHVKSNGYTFTLGTKAMSDCAHEETTEKVVAATCKRAGAKKTLCAYCGVVMAEEEIPMLTTHTWDEGAVTKQPTATAAGETTFTCTVCGDTRTETIPASGILGDVNEDGKVDSTDARLVLQYAVKKIDATKLELSVADVDGNGKVDSTDARLILQYAVKKITKFPAA